MSVSWSDPLADGSTNRFANKHLHVVKKVVDINQMINEGQQVLRDRNKSPGASVTQIGETDPVKKKDLYGKIRPNSSSLVVTNEAGLAALESWIESNALTSGQYTMEVKIGAIIQCELDASGSAIGANDTVTTCGSMTVSIEVSGSKKVVYHLCGVDMTGGQLRSFKVAPGGVAFVA